MASENAGSTSPTCSEWCPDSWKAKETKQQPTYEDAEQLGSVVATLSGLPPLVHQGGVDQLRQAIAKVQRGEAFILQGGDCAESFAECDAEQILLKIQLMIQMSLVVVYMSKLPVVRIGRIAGQYAKPRSSNDETRGEKTHPSYRGDLVNAIEFSSSARRHDPHRLIDGYHHAAVTLNFIRSLIVGGVGNLYDPHQWDLSFAKNSSRERAYRNIVSSVTEALGFIKTVVPNPIDVLKRVDFYTSHEALVLDYEQAMTRQVSTNDAWYNLGAHMVWIGLRTSNPTEGHVEYCRGIANPVGVKVGPDTDPDDVLKLMETINPHNIAGKTVLIHRMGADRIADSLVPLIRGVRASGHHVAWISDPMHGNTELTDTGVKTRSFDRIMTEIRRSFEIHESEDSFFGGVHLELTGENVTECIGGAGGLAKQDLGRDYRSTVDPRLNADQSLEVALQIGELQAKHAKRRSGGPLDAIRL